MCIFVHSSVSARLERSGPGSCLLPACDATRFRSLSAAARACLIHHHVVPVGAHNDPPTRVRNNNLSKNCPLCFFCRCCPARTGIGIAGRTVHFHTRARRRGVAARGPTITCRTPAQMRVLSASAQTETRAHTRTTHLSNGFTLAGRPRLISPVGVLRRAVGGGGGARLRVFLARSDGPAPFNPLGRAEMEAMWLTGQQGG